MPVTAFQTWMPSAPASDDRVAADRRVAAVAHAHRHAGGAGHGVGRHRDPLRWRSLGGDRRCPSRCPGCRPSALPVIADVGGAVVDDDAAPPDAGARPVADHVAGDDGGVARAALGGVRPHVDAVLAGLPGPGCRRRGSRSFPGTRCPPRHRRTRRCAPRRCRSSPGRPRSGSRWRRAPSSRGCGPAAPAGRSPRCRRTPRCCSDPAALPSSWRLETVTSTPTMFSIVALVLSSSWMQDDGAGAGEHAPGRDEELRHPVATGGHVDHPAAVGADRGEGLAERRGVVGDAVALGPEVPHLEPGAARLRGRWGAALEQRGGHEHRGHAEAHAAEEGASRRLAWSRWWHRSSLSPPARRSCGQAASAMRWMLVASLGSGDPNLAGGSHRDHDGVRRLRGARGGSRC